MLLIFKKKSGEVVDNLGTNSLFPHGIPDATQALQNVIDRIGGVEEDYDTLRLHDIEDAEIVNKTFSHEYSVQNGKVAFGSIRPIPNPEPQPPSETDILAEELVKMKFENMQKDNVISTFGEEITKLKLEMMILKGGA